MARLAFRDSRYEISVCETHEKRVSLLILTRESRENLARILDLKSESRFSREFKKVILVSTLYIFLVHFLERTTFVSAFLQVFIIFKATAA